MKKIQFLLIGALLVFFAGCQKDLPAPANVTDEQEALIPDGDGTVGFRAKEYVIKPMTLWVEATTDLRGCLNFECRTLNSKCRRQRIGYSCSIN